jgi:hypothetical protein
VLEDGLDCTRDIGIGDGGEGVLHGGHFRSRDDCTAGKKRARISRSS